jgi:hypothetical protein
VTIAQLVHPTLGLARLPRRPLFQLRSRVGHLWRSCNVTLWRAIAAGLVFAVIGLSLVVAIGAAGVAPLPAQPPEGVPVGTHAVPHHHLQIDQDPAEAFGWAMPVP